MYEHAFNKGGVGPVNLKGRDFLKILDYSKEELRYILDTSKKFKQLKTI